MRILIVEDEVKIALALKRGLEQEAFVVDAVHTGTQGLSYATSGDYDLIILDRLLPGITDGVEICRRVRQERLSVPILMLTARDKTSERVEGLNEGADDYLVKPFAFEELVARVRALLRRPGEPTPPVLQVEDLTLNPSTFEVKRAGKTINLSSKEFALLKYLLYNPNQILSKETLTNHVWDYDADILPNTVEVYIGYLRQKVDRPFKKPLIHTIRGFGYKIGAER